MGNRVERVNIMSLSTPNSVRTKFVTLILLVSTAIIFSSPITAQTVYGPVKSNDTLSKIIKRLYTGSKSSQIPIMRQIVSENPSSFLNGDMNLLKLNSSLNLPGSLWKNNPDAEIQSQLDVVQGGFVIHDLVDRSAPELTVEQMKGRIVFLDAERSSLIEEVGDLKRETARLEQKVLKLEADSRLSDEQLIILDAEIIRLTDLMKNNNSELANKDLNQLVVLQEKLRLVQEETSDLREQLAQTRTTLNKNDNNSQRANQTIALLTKENQQLQRLLQENQPGVNFYNEPANSANISLLSGKFQLPVGIVVVGGALLALMLTALITTRRKKSILINNDKEIGLDPFDNSNNFNSLLETESYEGREFSHSDIQPEENVFKMFDEGSLEMDLKLDMAEAYLEVSDFEAARSILQEVVEGGSELQKRKAARLIKKAA